MRLLKYSLLIISVLIRFSVLANSGAEEKPAEGHGGGEAKKEGKGGSAGGLPEWVELQGKIQALRAKIKAKEEALKKLVEEKEHVHAGAKAAEIVSSIKTEHKELKESAEEYNKLRNLLKYRFPEKGLQGEREYKRVEVQSLKEIENKYSVEGKLSGNLRRMRKQYQAPPDDPRKKKTVSHEPKQKPEESSADQSPILNPAIISK